VCGLIFSYDPARNPERHSQAASVALEALRHRGPDDAGLEGAGPWLAGHRRLSIVDLTGSHQPMWDPQSRYCLVFNGEIYNFRELRVALEPRWRFGSHGDTEVLLAGLVLHGPSFLARVEGMWALALWDQQASQLLLSRDRMGKKPLYYRETAKGGLQCASELPALKKLSEEPWAEDLDSAADYLRYGFSLPGTTCYSQIREVLPGHTATWSPGERLRETPFWRLSLEPFAGSREEAVGELRSRFQQAVARRLVADVEVGAFLSGGVDSSLIASFAVELSSSPVRTFAIGFADPTYDERPFARQVAARLGTRHYEACLDTLEPEALEPLILENVGEPFADPSLLPTAMVAKLAAEHLKVALSGDGGDELFSGYQRYQARAMLRCYTRLPALARTAIERGVRVFPEPLAHHSRSLLKKAHLFVEAARRNGLEGGYVAPRILAEDQLSVLAPDLAGRGHPPPGLAADYSLDAVQEMMATDALVYLPQDILAKVDRATMAHSLESRAPFLDTSLVSYCLSLPRHWHRRGIRGKRLLRQAFGPRLDSSIWNRRKQGFSVPVGAWFKGRVGSDLRTLAGKGALPFSAPALTRLLDEHQRGGRDFGLVLWTLYVYLLWRQRQFGA
jgi:asparagine synthase (glutamine-hydrolysing)